MAQVDWSRDLPNEGIYLAEVTRCEEKLSQKGDAMFMVQLKNVDDGSSLGRDFLMVGGKGRFIGRAKLIALGIPEGTKEVLSGELLGRRAWVNIAHEEYKGELQAKVSSDGDLADGSYFGYWPENEPPPGVDAKPASADDDADPFSSDDTPF